MFIRSFKRGNIAYLIIVVSILIAVGWDSFYFLGQSLDELEHKEIKITHIHISEYKGSRSVAYMLEIHSNQGMFFYRSPNLAKINSMAQKLVKLDTITVYIKNPRLFMFDEDTTTGFNVIHIKNKQNIILNVMEHKKRTYIFVFGIIIISSLAYLKYRNYFFNANNQEKI